MKILRSLFFTVLAVLAVVMFHGVFRAPPSGTMLEGRVARVSDGSVTFLHDVTYTNAAGQRVSEQQIFDAVLAMIGEARHYILLDMFLFNGYRGAAASTARSLSQELTDALVGKMTAHPGIVVQLVTDPINEVYGGARSLHLQALREAGIAVVVTDLSALRDSNPLMSAIWRIFLQPLGNSVAGGWLPHPFQEGGPDVTLRTYLSLMQFKANHRKLIVADSRREGRERVSTLVMSANPHDASSAHWNTALRIDDAVWRDAVRSEMAVAAFSDASLLPFQSPVEDIEGDLDVQLLTEGAIRRAALDLVRAAGEGDAVDILMFYLSDRGIVDELVAAQHRGADIRLILDPNKDAFGHEKNGIPNRGVAHELVTRTEGRIKVRWCETQGEQCHGKLLLWDSGDKSAMLTGSANFTRRNLQNFNLETAVLVRGDYRFSAIRDAYQHFDRLWQNGQDDGIFTAPYAKYDERTAWTRVLGRWMERTGLSSF